MQERGIEIASCNTVIMMHKFISFVCLFTLLACSSQEKGSESIVFEKRDDVKMSELITDYSLVKLETTEDNLIVDINQVEWWKDRIYILDSYSPTKGVYVFEKDGRYVGRIGRVGQGPGEYILPSDMVIDENSDKLVVKDLARNILMVYNLDSQEFEGEYEMPFYADCMEYLAPDRLIWYVGTGLTNRGDYCRHIQVTDMSGSSIASYMDREELPTRGLYNIRTLFHADEKQQVYFHHPFVPDIYRYDVQKNSAEYAYTLSWEGLKSPTQEYVMTHREQIVQVLKDEKYIMYHTLMENSEKILCYFGTDDTRYIGVYDKATHKGYYTPITSIIDDMGVLGFYYPKSVYNDKFVGVIYMENLDGIDENSILYPYSDGGKTDDAGNPVIVLFR